MNELLKTLHISCAFLSVTGFFIRGVWMIYYPAELQQRWVKITPHVVDSLLLASAIALVIMERVSPVNQPWLATKIVALLIYITLGMVALKYGRSIQVRITAWLAALVCVGYILAVAFTKSPKVFW